MSFLNVWPRHPTTRSWLWLIWNSLLQKVGKSNLKNWDMECLDFLFALLFNWISICLFHRLCLWAFKQILLHDTFSFRYDDDLSLLYWPSHILSLRSEDAVFRLRRPGGERLPGVAAGIQSCQHRAERPRSKARGVLRTARKGRTLFPFQSKVSFVFWVEQTRSMNKSWNWNTSLPAGGRVTPLCPTPLNMALLLLLPMGCKLAHTHTVRFPFLGSWALALRWLFKQWNGTFSLVTMGRATNLGKKQILEKKKGGIPHGRWDYQI